jgi:hypothetical protein
MTGAFYVYKRYAYASDPATFSSGVSGCWLTLPARCSRLLAGRQPHFRQKKITSETSHFPCVLSSSTWNQSTSIIGKVHAKFPRHENNLDLSKDFVVVFAAMCPGRLQSSSAS